MTECISRTVEGMDGSKSGVVVRTIVSRQSALGSNPGVDAICGLSLLLVLFLDPRGFFSGTTVSPSPQKPTFPNFNSTRSQVGEEPLYLVDVLPINRLGFETGKDSNLLRCTCSVVRKKIPGVRL